MDTKTESIRQFFRRHPPCPIVLFVDSDVNAYWAVHCGSGFPVALLQPWLRGLLSSKERLTHLPINHCQVARFVW